jgi:hypothetical protein
MYIHYLYLVTEWLVRIMLVCLLAGSILNWRRKKSGAAALQCIGAAILVIGIATHLVLRPVVEPVEVAPGVYQMSSFGWRHYVKPALFMLGWPSLALGYLIDKVNTLKAS